MNAVDRDLVCVHRSTVGLVNGRVTIHVPIDLDVFSSVLTGLAEAGFEFEREQASAGRSSGEAVSPDKGKAP